MITRSVMATVGITFRVMKTSRGVRWLLFCAASRDDHAERDGHSRHHAPGDENVTRSVMATSFARRPEMITRSVMATVGITFRVMKTSRGVRWLLFSRGVQR